MDDNARMSWKVRPLLQLPMAHIFILQTFSYRRTGYRESWYRSHRLDASGKQPIVLLQGYQMQGSKTRSTWRQVNGWR